MSSICDVLLFCVLCSAVGSLRLASVCVSAVVLCVVFCFGVVAAVFCLCFAFVTCVVFCFGVIAVVFCMCLVCVMCVVF